LSELNQNGYLTHGVTMFMDIIFKGKMWRTANLKMTVIVIKLFLLVYK